MAIKEFDVFVIGTGTAGKIVAKSCVKAGLKVAIADNREYGGTCANRGCDPKKVLVGLTEIIERSQQMQGKGISKMPEISWSDLMNFKKTFTGSVPAATEKDLKKLGIEMYHQSPKFLDETTLSVEGKTVKAKKIVIATGNKPLKLDIPGIELALESDDFLDLEELPESMIFIGAGYIGMELSHVAARFGVKVTIVEAGPRALANFDEDMVLHLQKASEELGIEFIFDAEVSAIEKLQKNFRITANRKGKNIELKAEMVINSAGRVPSIDELDLEKGNVEFSKKGISVNKFLQSVSNKNVYACGDVSASEGLPLTPLSSEEGQLVANNLLNPKSLEEAIYPPQPSVVFTIPNLASVGFSEKEAKENGHEFTLKQNSVPNWFNAKRINSNQYAFKTLVETKTDKILGVHLIGPEAAETINMFALAMSAGTTVKGLKKTIFAYPTWAGDISSMV